VLRGTLELRRVRVLSDVLEETLRITNFNSFSVTLHLLYEFSADFADIFDVRGYRRERQGQRHPAQVSERSIVYRYTGIDGVDRSTGVHFDRRPNYIDETTALFRITLPRRQALTLRTEVRIDNHKPKRRSAQRGRVEAVAADYERWMSACTHIWTDNEFFNRVIDRSLRDARMLWSETETGEPYPAAGTPWFDAPFGRDSCIMSMQYLPYRPELARDALRLLAQHQGRNIDPVRDEEPGKILHELRFDELSRSGELPYSPYYGSIDSTPLFLMLAAEYFAWTNDVRLIRLLMPTIRDALTWVELFGERDGYLAYEKRSAKGLVNQGWKDSWDAVVHADGSLAPAPVALAEAQGYAYAARARLASAVERAGDAKLAERLRRDARKLYRKFNEEFWDEELGFFALAIDGTRRRASVLSTNPAHCMWAGLVDPQRAEQVNEKLMSPEMFSGWGLRTISDQHPRYNPLGYHLGTVWPHDNSVAAMGMKMYGLEDSLNTLASALFDAAASFPYFRLPELFGGETRTAHGPPVPYPVACNPQSWAAGTFPLITQAMLGIKAEAPEGRLRIVNPKLPPWLNRVRVSRMRVGNGTVALLYRRMGDETRVEVEEATNGLDVVFSKTWPLAL
jgi:glycogen debranching enzyme